MGKKHIEIKEYTLTFTNLPASFDGCRLGFMADFHNDIIGEKNKDILEAIKREHYDYLLCAGDMIVGSDNGHFAFENAVSFLTSLADELPVYYSLGNHEERMRKFLSAAKDYSILDEYKNRISDISEHINHFVMLLDNENCIIKRGQDKITITGFSLPIDYYKRWWNRKTLMVGAMREAVQRVDGFRILLAHNPIFFQTYNAFGSDLVLSGHLHGGLMVIPFLGGVISPEYTLFPKYDFGYFQESKSQMIVSRGLGAHTLPIRINNRPEIVSITLKRD